MISGVDIEIIKLTKRFGSLTVVDDISLKVKAGEFLTLLGSSGCGKTTTLMSVAGFIFPESGKIILNGKDITDYPPEKRGLGVVFQNYALFPNYNVFENVAFPLRLRKINKNEITEKVNETLVKVGLKDYSNRQITELSGGQQQRVALARSIVFSPSVLLMDEPLSALDRKMRDQLQTELKRIQKELGVTVIYVTHDQEEALTMSDRIAIMDNGKIIQLGDPVDVYEHPVNKFVAGFLGESNFIKVKFLKHENQYLLVHSDYKNNNPFKAKNINNISVNNDLVAMVRPDSFSLYELDNKNIQNKVRLHIKHSEYLGSAIRIMGSSDIGDLVAKIERRYINENLVPGNSVDLFWSADDFVLLSETK